MPNEIIARPTVCKEGLGAETLVKTIIGTEAHLYDILSFNVSNELKLAPQMSKKFQLVLR